MKNKKEFIIIIIIIIIICNNDINHIDENDDHGKSGTKL